MKLPISTRKAFKILDEMSTPEEKAQFLKKSKLDFVLDQHFGLAMWIRNNWIYDHEGVLDLFEDPDDASSKLLEKYYDHLKRMQ